MKSTGKSMAGFCVPLDVYAGLSAMKQQDGPIIW